MAIIAFAVSKPELAVVVEVVAAIVEVAIAEVAIAEVAIAEADRR
jgi:hypothetical protein